LAITTCQQEYFEHFDDGYWSSAASQFTAPLPQTMSLWVDKSRPSTLNKLTLHPEITTRLQSLAKSDELPHLLFYGPSGAGKKTRVMALLREIYGPSVERVKLEHRSFKTTTNKTVEITTLGSNYHIECNPSDAGNSDRFVIQEVIKEIASHGNLQSGTAGAKGFKIGTEKYTFESKCREDLRRINRY
jgi:replication factor C subunit 3/5